MKNLIFILLLIPSLCRAQEYPVEWFKEIPRNQAASWEILPQDAKLGEVILSKRTELGIFSNFGATAFVLDGKKFASVEGLWQSLKYPDPEILEDSRHSFLFPHTRAEVEQMVDRTAKMAGNEANKIYLDNGLKNINWGNHFFDYTDRALGSDYHYILIKRAIKAKLDQNPELWKLLLKTGCLILRPDHKMGENNPPSFHYEKIYMQLRSERQKMTCENGPSF